MTGFCGPSIPSNGYTTGVLLGLGSQDPTNPSCFNGYTASNVVGVPMPSSGTLKNLTVAALSTLSSGSIQIIVTVNSVETRMSCYLSVGPSMGSCTDNFDTYQVQPGDRVAVQVTAFNAINPGSLSMQVSLEKQ